MESLIMANMNTLIKRVYLLAGVIMAANMFIVNEVRATAAKVNENTLITKEKDKEFSIINVLLNSSGPVLYWENTINIAVGFVFSSVNNYFRWWNYNAGGYRKLGCFGWRSGRFLKDYLQFEINLNVGRGILWLIPGAYFVINNNCDVCYTAISVSNRINTDLLCACVFWVIFLIQGFVSVPLAIHFSNFSIAISLDSILWASVGKFLSVGKNLTAVDGYKEVKQYEGKDEIQDREFYGLNPYDITENNTEDNDNKSINENYYNNDNEDSEKEEKIE